MLVLETRGAVISEFSKGKEICGGSPQLALLAAGAFGCGWLVMAVPLSSLRRVTCKGGTLESLGLNKRHIGHVKAMRLRRWW